MSRHEKNQQYSQRDSNTFPKKVLPAGLGAPELRTKDGGMKGEHSEEVTQAVWVHFSLLSPPPSVS